MDCNVASKRETRTLGFVHILDSCVSGFHCALRASWLSVPSKTVALGGNRNVHADVSHGDWWLRVRITAIRVDSLGHSFIAGRSDRIVGSQGSPGQRQGVTAGFIMNISIHNRFWPEWCLFADQPGDKNDGRTSRCFAIKLYCGRSL